MSPEIGCRAGIFVTEHESSSPQPVPFQGMNYTQGWGKTPQELPWLAPNSSKPGKVFLKQLGAL